MSLLLRLTSGAPPATVVDEHVERPAIVAPWVYARSPAPDVEEIAPAAVAATLEEHAPTSALAPTPAPGPIASPQAIEEFPASAAVTFADEPAEASPPRAWAFVIAAAPQADEDLPAVAVAALASEHVLVIAPLVPPAATAPQPGAVDELVALVPDEHVTLTPTAYVAIRSALATEHEELASVPDELVWQPPAPLPPLIGRWTPVAEEEISQVLAVLAWDAHHAIGQPTLPRAALWLQTHASEQLAGPVAPVVLTGEAAATEELAQLFSAGWSSRRPAVPLALEGESFDAADQWARFSVIHATRHQTTFGGGTRRVEVRGFAAVQLFAPANAGQLELAAMAEDARSVLDGVTGAIVTTYQGTTRPAGEDGRWIVALVVVPFWYVELVAT